MDQIIKDFAEAIMSAGKKKRQGYDSAAKVLRVDGDTLWVHIPGGVPETPVKRTVDAKAGDTIQVRLAGRKAWACGNATDPPTSDARVKKFEQEMDKVVKILNHSISRIYTNVQGLGTLIRESVAGIEVGKVNGAGEYTGGHTLINAETNTYDVYEQSGARVASFGKKSVIGEEDGLHTAFDADTWQILDEDGNVILHIGTPAGEDLEEIYTYYSGDPGFTLHYLPAESPVLVLFDWDSGTTHTLVEGTDYTISQKDITILAQMTMYDEITAYYTTEEDVKYFTFGNRRDIPGELSFATGNEVVAIGVCSHAEGYQTKSSGYYAHAEGRGTHAGDVSHAEGYLTHAEGYSHTEGSNTSANHGSHAEGFQASAEGMNSHAEGNTCRSSGDYSHAEGYWTIAEGDCSHSGGIGTYADQDHMTAIGEYNEVGKTDCLFAIGNGLDNNHRSNAFDVSRRGRLGGSCYTDWTIATLDGVFDAWDTANTPRYKRHGDMVTIVGRIKPQASGTITGSRQQIFTLPAGFRPAQVLEFVCPCSSNAIWNLTVYANGKVQAGRLRTGNTNPTIDASTCLMFCVTYMTDEDIQ